MDDQFVPYDLVLRLEKLGFDFEECLAHYEDFKLIFGKTDDFKKAVSDLVDNIKIIEAPLYDQVFKWFRKEKKYDSWIVPLHICLNGRPDSKKWCYVIEKSEYDESFSIDDESEFETYEEARTACIEKLIEIVENEK